MRVVVADAGRDQTLVSTVARTLTMMQVGGAAPWVFKLLSCLEWLTIEKCELHLLPCCAVLCCAALRWHVAGMQHDRSMQGAHGTWEAERGSLAGTRRVRCLVVHGLSNWLTW